MINFLIHLSNFDYIIGLVNSYLIRLMNHFVLFLFRELSLSDSDYFSII